MRIRVLLLAVGIVSCSVNPVQQDPYAQKLSELRAKQSTAEFKERGWTTFIENTARGATSWTFTPDSHPAHPSFASRRIVRKQDSSLSVQTHLRCGAAEKECAQLKDEYDLLDARLRDQAKKDQRV